jgi:hypothetical protein
MDNNKTAILRPLISSLFIASAFLTLPAAAGWFADTMTDPLDGKMDASKFLAEEKGFLPVPIIITEPAVGYGLGIAGVFFHDPLAGKTEPGTEFEPNPDADGNLKPPSASALFAGYTENDTWFAGGMHRGIWKDDTLRYTGVLVEANVNMKFYGLDSGNGNLGGNPVSFNTKATYFLQELLFRIKESNFFTGLEYTYLKTDNTFDTSDLFPDSGLPNVEFDSTSAGLGLVLQYEDLNNTMTPGQGLKAQVNMTNYGDRWGGDSEFNKYRIFANYWFPASTDWVVGLRADTSAVTGDPPFYEYPYIDLRGIPAMRYQGEQTIVGETEVRWDFTPRWSAIGFVGAGKAVSDRGNGDDETVISKGIGFRYLIARRFGLRAGIDVAWGPEDTAFYIQVGNAWTR